MLRWFLSTIMTLLVIMCVGTLMLNLFPGLRPVWEEFKKWGITAYEYSVANIGILGTVVLIIALTGGVISKKF